jgi:hypothetical protein
METLRLIDELRTALGDRSGDAVSDIVCFIESSLETDLGATSDERALVRRLKSNVSALIAARRDGLNVEVTQSNVILSALESSIKGRTTGRTAGS